MKAIDTFLHNSNNHRYWGDSKYSLGTILGVYSGVGLLAAASSASLRETLGALLG
eukprot:m.75447 g.75447  ORF g.75447 m.75447 type:complete len:55 (-) comp12500_c0_seq3:72-236(-)